MKIAIVLVTAWWRASIDLDGLAAALARLGHEPLLICRRNDAGAAAFPVIEATAEEVNTPAFWRSLGLDAGIVYNWLRGAAMIEAMHAAGVRTVLRADHDGQASVRLFPAAHWAATVATAPPRRRLRAALHWLHRWGRLHREEDAELLRTLRAADAVAIESEAAASHLRTVLDWYHEPGGKLHIVPHSVPDAVLAAPFLAPTREPLIFAGGRWDDPQKDAPLLCATLQRLLPRLPLARIVIAGRGSCEAFARWAAHPQVTVAGALPRSEVIDLLGRSRFLLSTSRWETQPIGTLEQLALGGSVVGPRLPGLIALADEGRSGTLAPQRTAQALAQAAAHEWERWETGERHPTEIAARWRARVSNEAVATALLAALSA